MTKLGTSKIKKRYLKWIPNWLTPPLIIIMVFLFIFIFTDEFSYINIHKKQTEIDVLTAEIKAQNDSTAYYTKKLNELNTSPEMLEKVAREQYGMKRANEDVYVTDIP